MMYNETVKNDYLERIKNNFSENTYKQVLSTLKKASEIEKVYDKDLCDFNYKEMIELLKHFRCKSFNSITSKFSTLRAYIDFCRAENKGLSVSAGYYITTEDVKECVSTTGKENRYCTRSELQTAIMSLINPSDKSIFMLLFEGVMGKEYNEIRELKVSDIDFTNRIVKLKDREVVVSEFTNNILMATSIAEEYYRYSDMVLNYKSYSLEDLSPYLIKLRKNIKNPNNSPMKVTGIKSRITDLKKVMEKNLLTGKTIYISGIMERVVKEEIKNNKELSRIELKELLDKWGINMETGDSVRVLNFLREKIKSDLIK